MTRLKNDMFPRDRKKKTKNKGEYTFTVSHCPDTETCWTLMCFYCGKHFKKSNTADIQKNYPCPLKSSVASTDFLERGSVEFIQEKSSEGQALRAPSTSHLVPLVRVFVSIGKHLKICPIQDNTDVFLLCSFT